MSQLEQTKNSLLGDFLNVLEQNRAISIRYLSVLFPVAVCLGAICFIETNVHTQLVSKICQVAIFCGAGVMHLYILKKRVSLFWVRFFGEGILYTLSITVIMCILLLVFYIVTDSSLTLMAFASSSAFMLPHILLQAWCFFNYIPRRSYDIWTSPACLQDNDDDILFPGNKTVNLKVSSHYFDINQQLFSKTVSGQMKLGTLFYSILEEENKKRKYAIECCDIDKNPYAWEFYVESFGNRFKRRVNPELSLLENGIKDHATVRVKRVRQRNAEKNFENISIYENENI